MLKICYDGVSILKKTMFFWLKTGIFGQKIQNWAKIGAASSFFETLFETTFVNVWHFKIKSTLLKISKIENFEDELLLKI